jgi:hypothetical protein
VPVHGGRVTPEEIGLLLVGRYSRATDTHEGPPSGRPHGRLVRSRSTVWRQGSTFWSDGSGQDQQLGSTADDRQYRVRDPNIPAVLSPTISAPAKGAYEKRSRQGLHLSSVSAALESEPPLKFISRYQEHRSRQLSKPGLHDVSRIHHELHGVVDAYRPRPWSGPGSCPAASLDPYRRAPA